MNQTLGTHFKIMLVDSHLPQKSCPKAMAADPYTINYFQCVLFHLDPKFIVYRSFVVLPVTSWHASVQSKWVPFVVLSMTLNLFGPQRLLKSGPFDLPEQVT